MKKTILTIFHTVGLMLSAMYLLTGCSDDENPAPGNNGTPLESGYAISTVSGAWPDMTTYIQWVPELGFTSIGNDQAIELTGKASTVSYGGAVYAMPFGAPANLVKYVVGSDSVPKEEERIVVPGANTFASLHFKSETLAYGTVSGGISKLIIFDPSTMRITDEISLSAVTGKFSEATRTYYLDMLERDNKLFMGVHYENNFEPVNDSAYIAIIDLNTNEVEKVLSDGRTGMFFGGHAPKTGMILDEKGDIYVQALGTTNAGGEAPSGVLRIKKGQTDFDQGYFLDLEAVTGNICLGIYHTSTGRTFTAKVQDETDFWEYATGQPQFKYVEIDLLGKTSKGDVPGLPVTYGSRSMIIREMDHQNLLFTIATNDENTVYEFDVSSNSSSTYFNSKGGYITGLEKLD
ncbi:DUF4374 domain-containing protein [Rapidithrix thailandica]|uniref:DUF4374 domain-containing protein n=1 Tax=Rapidithrix thailandica TaxID=413964 RepID=A0AAW9SAJ5_9BACT